MGKSGIVISEKEFGRFPWSKSSEIVVRVCEYKKKPDSEVRRGIDIRVYVNGKGYIGWSKEGFWIYEEKAEQIVGALNKALEELKKSGNKLT